LDSQGRNRVQHVLAHTRPDPTKIKHTPVGTTGEKSIRLIVRPGTSEIITAYPVP
jgi:hypothetical protein